MRSFNRGEKVVLADLTPATDITVGLDAVGSGGETFDISCFGVNADDQLFDDRYFIFYNQRSSPEGAVTALGRADGDAEVFQVALGQLPQSIRKLVFTITLDERQSGSMASLRQGHIRVLAGATEIGRYAFSGTDFGAERAIIAGQLYVKGGWRFAAVGQGYSGGLSALLAHFGGQEIGAASAPAPAPVPAPPVAVPVGAPAGAPVNLRKVVLEKSGDRKRVDLRKGGGNQPLHFNLNWENVVAGGRRGFLAGLAGGGTPDLDLGCMYELTDGSAGVVQPLGGNFGSRTGPPYIYLDKDDRSGAAADGENLYLLRPDLIRRVLVFALIYQGAPDFRSVQGRMTIRDQDGNEILVQLDNPDANRTFCAICTVTRSGEAVEVTKEERYFRNHRDADHHYGFGFQWTAGRK